MSLSPLISGLMFNTSLEGGRRSLVLKSENTFLTSVLSVFQTVPLKTGSTWFTTPRSCAHQGVCQKGVRGSDGRFCLSPNNPVCGKEGFSLSSNAEHRLGR
ncbi:hypothetical protein E2C01_045789 [Portunus trituberculatus]|uniref:Uncharacterized protein n=1 Tax=Portunus trituberculatus TaxID=210409 RepID=A0A5B7G3Y0_PORTR|nr:hypothetical protein [Portunus trituberculatus]